MTKVENKRIHKIKINIKLLTCNKKSRLKILLQAQDKKFEKEHI
jgi:hypothetical protein